VVLVVSLEWAAYAFHGVPSILASRIWILHGLFYAASSLILVVSSLGQDVRARSPLPLLVLGLLTFLIFAGTAGVETVNVNGESTLQVAVALRSLALPDLGYTQASFGGYPNRQYLLTALPSIVMGRGFWPLRLGYAIPFWTGLLVCYCGLRALFASWGGATRLASVVVLSFFTFPYVFSFLQRYEQAILPIAFAMHVIGWGLLCTVRPTPFRFVNLMWPCGMAATSYTPGVALWGLCLVFFLGLALRRWKISRPEAISWLSCALFQTGIGAATFLTRGDMRLKPESSDLPRDLAVGLKILLFGEPRSFVSPILMLPILLYVLNSLAGRGGIGHFAIGAWSLCVVAMSIVARGMFAHSSDMALLRALVIVPVLGTGMAWRIQRLALDRGIAFSERWLWLGAAILAVYSAFSFDRARNEFPMTVRETVVRDVIAQVQRMGLQPESRFVLGLVSNAGELANAADYADYFWPHADVLRAPDPATLAARVRQAPEPAIAYIDRKRWQPDVSLPEDVRVDILAPEGPFGSEFVRLTRTARPRS